jgi:uncharacterized membrane protein
MGLRTQGAMMPTLTVIDYVAVGWFFAAWAGYTVTVDYSPLRRRSVSAAMNGFRRRWIAEMLKRDIRLVDTQILGNLMNGISIFASTTILLVGGLFALLGASDAAISAMADLPIAIRTTRPVWEGKILMLVVIFIYAFFKFAWAYRLSNYCAILIGAAPSRAELAGSVDATTVERLARIANQMGHHFNRGLRAYFFALATLGWFIHPALFMVASTWVLLVLYRRDFRSREFHLLGGARGESATESARS